MRRSAYLLVTLLACSCVILLSSCAGTYKPKGQKIPEGFQINCYNPSECTKSDSTPLPGNQSQQIVVLITDDDMDKVVAWYKTELTFKGYRVLSDNKVKGKITLECDGDKNHCTVTCLPVGDKEPKTVISVSVFPKPI
jgi:hypothetical protein